MSAESPEEYWSLIEAIRRGEPIKGNSVTKTAIASAEKKYEHEAVVSRAIFKLVPLFVEIKNKASELYEYKQGDQTFEYKQKPLVTHTNTHITLMWGNEFPNPELLQWLKDYEYKSADITGSRKIPIAILVADYYQIDAAVSAQRIRIWGVEPTAEYPKTALFIERPTIVLPSIALALDRPFHNYRIARKGVDYLIKYPTFRRLFKRG